MGINRPVWRQRLSTNSIRPHLRPQSAEERVAEERRLAARALTGSNSTPLIHVDDRKKSAKRLSSPERFEIKQLIASGAVDAADVG